MVKNYINYGITSVEGFILRKLIISGYRNVKFVFKRTRTQLNLSQSLMIFAFHQHQYTKLFKKTFFFNGIVMKVLACIKINQGT